ncbi:mannose-1-phosphate guanylyltransferase/mannose-6-phosphate isomerase [Citrobacter braakii]|uniref:mannose-1-phosphate guanylyltransferase/mannose-6-phosphate isomerase n=1 Tax=Citrobacter braakii TaxID=57706 RepID=UPI001C24F1C8|nr:mannose-1-phosphate guanylyltransferase/mannose-6-phosphate isomerase [Citrobacter braakii]QXA94718.1 mannose-1-phosphate guanylyltransferase/mannose-6-phosphate isomerase [Citrobacter braakii]
MKSKILPVVMAGGSGSRLWPMSRAHFPKQFLKLAGDNTMLQDTIFRLSGIEHSASCFICNHEHRFLVAEQLRNADIPHSGIILEPFGRNTAPAVALSAIHSMKDGEDPILFVLASDHLIQDTVSFTNSVLKGIEFAEKGKLVTFGIVPTKAETGYGYIRRGLTIGDDSCYAVDAFVEKPDIDTATQYLRDGGYYWNSGMFMFKASRFIAELRKFCPQIYAAAKASYDGARNDLDFIRIDKDSFQSCPDDSIDYAVMEKTTDSVVISMDAGWSDVGSWSSLWEVSEKNSEGNVLRGDILVDNSEGCYIHAHERLVAAVGLHDLIIVDTKDALLVAHRDKVQDVKNIVSNLKKNNRSEFQYHREVYRPWGQHDRIAEGERYHVKKVTVKPGQKTTMQQHYHRSEHWVIVSGTAKVYRDNEVLIITENESVFIPVGVSHCFENPGKVPLEIIEVRTGSYLGEDDIVRSSSQMDDY